MKNTFSIKDNICFINISYRNKIFICEIDLEDLPKVSKFKTTWFLNINRSGHIDGVKTKVQIDGIRKQIWLHNIIINKENENNIVDHIDQNVLNNKKDNLREISKKLNATNISINIKSNVGYRNVTISKGKYRVRINGKSFGVYDNLEEAKKIADLNRSIIFPLSSNSSKKNNK